MAQIILNPAPTGADAIAGNVFNILRFSYEIRRGGAIHSFRMDLLSANAPNYKRLTRTFIAPSSNPGIYIENAPGLTGTSLGGDGTVGSGIYPTTSSIQTATFRLKTGTETITTTVPVIEDTFETLGPFTPTGSDTGSLLFSSTDDTAIANAITAYKAAVPEADRKASDLQFVADRLPTGEDAVAGLNYNLILSLFDQGLFLGFPTESAAMPDYKKQDAFGTGAGIAALLNLNDSLGFLLSEGFIYNPDDDGFTPQFSFKYKTGTQATRGPETFGSEEYFDYEFADCPENWERIFDENGNEVTTISADWCNKTKADCDLRQDLWDRLFGGNSPFLGFRAVRDTRQT